MEAPKPLDPADSSTATSPNFLRSSIWTPGCKLAACPKEAPIALNAVEPFQPAACSRPGPAAELRDGVFRNPAIGKYAQSTNVSFPDCIPTSSITARHSSHPSLPQNQERFRLRPDVTLFSRNNAVHRTTSSRKHDLTVYYQNVNGMNSDIIDYRLAVSDRCYDVIVLTETWLDSRTLSSQAFGKDYEVFRCDRNPNNSQKLTGGGVLVAVRSVLKARVIENEDWKCVEQAWVAVKLTDRTLYLCVVYIAPDRVRDKNLIETHCRSVYAILERATPTDDIMILGDFNLPKISWKPSHNGFLYPDPARSTFHLGAVSLLDTYSAATLSQINSIVNERHRSLDLCFVSAEHIAPPVTRAPTSLVKEVPLHPPLLFSIESSHEQLIDNVIATFSYDFRKADHRCIAGVLSSIQWETILNLDNLETAAETFSHVLSYVIDRHVPKKVHEKETHPPWQTRELRKLKSTKKAALRRFTKYRTLPLKHHYVRLNYEYKRISRRCYSRYLRGVERKFKSHPKSFWSYVNEQRREPELPSSMTLNGREASTPEEICRLFALKFASVFSEETITNDQVAMAACNVPPFNQVMGAIDINVDMIQTAAQKLKSSFNPGPDGVPSALLKKHIASLLPPLRILFQKSISSGTFPSCWKLAHMFPVHKKGSKRDVNNYRGITSLSSISKLFELVIMEPLLSHCKQYLSDDQHGFISGRSTTTNLLCLTSYITDSMTDRAQTDVIYTDLSAAFDKLNHKIALAKLDRLGINGNLLEWFTSYLSDRQLTVNINDCQSATYAAPSGIPQGSHLGPLIFLLYFNDVNLVLEVRRLSYADDLKMYIRVRSIDDCHFLQSQFEAFDNWCNLNRMEVNPEKCSIITFSRRKRPILFDYVLHGTAISRVNSIKDLGVILDSQLMFKEHVSYIVNKASKTLGFIFRIAKGFSDIYCLKSLYCSLVRSTLEYCSAVWNPGYDNGSERVESVQRRFLRFALRKLPWRNPLRLPSYENRCQLIDLVPLRVRRNTSRALFVADTLQNRIDCASILEQINLNVRPRALRNNIMLRLPHLRTNYGMQGAINGLQRVFNRVASLFDFDQTRGMLRRRFSRFFFDADRRS